MHYYRYECKMIDLFTYKYSKVIFKGLTYSRKLKLKKDKKFIYDL